MDPLILNPSQNELLLILQEISTNFSKRRFLGSRLKKTGIYIHGSTGCGKTMLMKEFYKNAKIDKKIVHYQEFIQDTHKILHEQNLYNKIHVLAKEFSSQYKLLCVDEFEIKDITDAMLVYKLFCNLLQSKVFIALTSNTNPENLYLNGIQRDSFLPFIKIIIEDFFVHKLTSDVDYRCIKKQTNNKIIVINDKQKQDFFNKEIDRITNHYDYTKKIIKVFGREISFERVHKDILVVTFEDICRNNFSSADYIEICKNFEYIVIENVVQIRHDETDVAVRFINLIDNMYFNGVEVLMSIECEMEDLYKDGIRSFEFKRSISRMREINSR